MPRPSYCVILCYILCVGYYMEYHTLLYEDMEHNITNNYITSSPVKHVLLLVLYIYK
jgi:hypothetical protein